MKRPQLFDSADGISCFILSFQMVKDNISQLLYTKTLYLWK